MKVQLSKEVADFITQYSTCISTEEGMFFFMPWWYKQTDDPLVFEEVLFDRLPDSVKSAIQEIRERKTRWDEMPTVAFPESDQQATN